MEKISVGQAVEGKVNVDLYSASSWMRL